MHKSPCERVATQLVSNNRRLPFGISLFFSVLDCVLDCQTAKSSGLPISLICCRSSNGNNLPSPSPLYNISFFVHPQAHFLGSTHSRPSATTFHDFHLRCPSMLRSYPQGGCKRHAGVPATFPCANVAFLRACHVSVRTFLQHVICFLNAHGKPGVASFKYRLPL
jgi:hypothetical protein